jgi:hypothetical protein
MKSFKVIDGKVNVDGVIYGQSPKEDVKIFGKSGHIHSINIEGRGQFFPIGGEFNDGSVKVVDSTTDILDETPKKKGKLAKTELVESSSKPMSEDGKPIKKSKKGSK